MSGRYDKFMVQVGIGTNRKVRRLSIPERWVFVAGVLATAAQSPLRGALLIVDGEPATAKDIAHEATVPIRYATAAMHSLERLGMLERDEHGVLWVHDWDKLNPDPKPSDSPAATRQRKRKQRETERGHTQVTPTVTPSVTPLSRVTPRVSHAPEVEVEVEEKNLPLPPEGNRVRDRHRFDNDVRQFAAQQFGIESDEGWRNVRGAILSGARSPDEIVAWLNEWRPDLAPKESAA